MAARPAQRGGGRGRARALTGAVRRTGTARTTGTTGTAGTAGTVRVIGRRRSPGPGRGMVGVVRGVWGPGWDGGVARFRAHAPPVSSCPGRFPWAAVLVAPPGADCSSPGTHTRTSELPSRLNDAAGIVPPFVARSVRVTLRVARAPEGTGPRGRGICPERPPTLR
ncbi:hypothetical protein GCM10010510_45210 [Streptomyces anandii JCM 4720]|nr:hypothetical protein GCM10010510_45210 [Streptomyces anandii JCM 4720]